MTTPINIMLTMARADNLARIVFKRCRSLLGLRLNDASEVIVPFLMELINLPMQEQLLLAQNLSVSSSCGFQNVSQPRSG